MVPGAEALLRNSTRGEHKQMEEDEEGEGKEGLWEERGGLLVLGKDNLGLSDGARLTRLKEMSHARC